ncbi:MAG TPA: YraN family protein [Bordetella sp.]|uniref:YraN family protein n=1 Tax=Bordetella sp. TaxID=28081 RepID=UPI002ED4F15D
MRSTGQRFEDLACHALQRAGLTLLARNYHTRHGEIDLIMRDGDSIVFVEVRFRRSAYHGSAADSVTASKRDKLLKAADAWLATTSRHASAPCRFDVVSYDGSDEHARMTWLRAAFDATT